MRLMIRKPILQPSFDDLNRTLTCLDLADTIIRAFQEAPAKADVLKFPAVQYLLGATMASLSILTTEKSLRHRHADLTISAAEMLKQSCSLSWVSRGTSRTIARLYALVHATLGKSGSDLPHSFGTTEQFRDPLLMSRSGAVQAVSANSHHAASNGLAQQGPYEDSNGHMHSTNDGSGNEMGGMLDTNISGDGLALPSTAFLANMGWPELNLDEFDFENSLNGGPPGLSAEDDLLAPWDGSHFWLGRLGQTPRDGSFNS